VILADGIDQCKKPKKKGKGKGRKKEGNESGLHGPRKKRELYPLPVRVRLPGGEGGGKEQEIKKKKKRRRIDHSPRSTLDEQIKTGEYLLTSLSLSYWQPDRNEGPSPFKKKRKKKRTYSLDFNREALPEGRKREGKEKKKKREKRTRRSVGFVNVNRPGKVELLTNICWRHP